MNLIEQPNLQTENEEVDIDESRYLGEAITAATYFPHPYQAELRNLTYLEQQMGDASGLCPARPQQLAQQAFPFVDSETAFQEMLEELSQSDVHEIAVDLEHHSIR